MNFLRVIGGLKCRAGAVFIVVFHLLIAAISASAQEVVLPASAKQVSVREAIDLRWALQQTLANNQALKLYPFQQRQAEALKLQAGLRPVATLDLSIENAFGSGEYAGVDSAEAALTLSQTVEMGGKRLQRMGLADAELRQQELEYEMSRLDVLAETSRRYYQLLAVQQSQALLERNIIAQRRALTVISQRAEAGGAGQADVSKMDLRLAKSTAQRQQLLDEQRLAAMRLAAMWQSLPHFQRATGELINLPALPSASRVLQSLAQSPALLNYLSLERLHDARVSLAQANGRSNISFGLGIKQLQASSDQALMLSFSMPLAFSNPNRGRIAQALAGRELASVQTELARAQLELQLLEIQRRLDSYRTQSKNLQQQLIPKAQTLLTDTEQGYRRGAYSVLALVDAQAELVILEQALIDTHKEIYLQLLELERITGQPFALLEQGAAS